MRLAFLRLRASMPMLAPAAATVRGTTPRCRPVSFATQERRGDQPEFPHHSFRSSDTTGGASATALPGRWRMSLLGRSFARTDERAGKLATPVGFPPRGAPPARAGGCTGKAEGCSAVLT